MFYPEIGRNDYATDSPIFKVYQENISMCIKDLIRMCNDMYETKGRKLKSYQVNEQLKIVTLNFYGRDINFLYTQG